MIPTECLTFKTALGPRSADHFDTGLPVLGGEPTETIFGDATAAGHHGSLSLFRRPGWLFGAASLPAEGDLERVAHAAYRDIFAASRQHRLARIWNYVPSINAVGAGGLENYRIFCRARSLAFEETFGRGFKAAMPSASAVGCRHDRLTVVFAATESTPRHFENPLQVPAYEYPGEYGPRSPSFARATVVAKPAPCLFVSGTAAIRGHRTVAPGDTRTQLDVTLENLQAIFTASGLDRTPNLNRFYRVYVRHAHDHALVSAVLEERLFRSGEVVSYLHTDICRAPLNVEIDVTVV